MVAGRKAGHEEKKVEVMKFIPKKKTGDQGPI